jgi:opacity protein-like surface antigen
MFKGVNLVHCASAVTVLLLAGAPHAEAQIVRIDGPRQSIGFNLGYFSVRGLDSRADGDVLLADLSQGEYSLDFDVKDFNGAMVGGEWLVGLSDYLEGGVGLGFYQRTVNSFYERRVRDDFSEIEQDLKLRVIPVTATVRFLPIGRGGVEPYVGAGIGAFNWRYSEVGEFIDDFDDSIFRQRYIDSGTAIGPVVLGGIRFPVSDVFTAGGELRYQKAEGKIDDTGFLGDRIDLGGWSTSSTVHLRF